MKQVKVREDPLIIARATFCTGGDFIFYMYALRFDQNMVHQNFCVVLYFKKNLQAPVYNVFLI
jgi:hypothetical protein